MSAYGPKRTSLVAPHMSAFGSKADMTIALRKPARLGGLSPIVWERDDMKVILRRATEADAKHAASLLTELGYPSTEAETRKTASFVPCVARPVTVSSRSWQQK